MYKYTIEKIGHLLNELGFSKIKFEYIDFNEWFYSALTEENSKVIICFNTYYHDIDFAYKNDKATFYNFCNVLKICSIRPSLHKILLDEESAFVFEEEIPNDTTSNKPQIFNFVDLPFNLKDFDIALVPSTSQITESFPNLNLDLDLIIDFNDSESKAPEKEVIISQAVTAPKRRLRSDRKPVVTTL